jgi:hypothetical protein
MDQHGAVHRRDQLEGLEDRLHRAALAHDGVEAVAVAQLGAKLGVLLTEAPLLHPGLEDARELRNLERLDEKIGRPSFHGRHRLGDAPETGDHHGQDVGIAGQRRVENLHAVGVRQAEVDDEGVVGESLEAFDGVGGVRGLRHLEAVRAQGFGDQLAEIGFIIDDEDGGLGGARHGMGTCLCARNQPTAGADGVGPFPADAPTGEVA